MKRSDISNNIGAKEHIRNGLLGSLFAAACGHPLFAIGSIVAGFFGANSDIKKANQIYDQHAHFFENCELHWKLYDEAYKIRDEYTIYLGQCWAAKMKIEEMCNNEIEIEDEVNYHGFTRVHNLASQLGHGFTMWTPEGKYISPIIMTLDVTVLRMIKKAKENGDRVTCVRINVNSDNVAPYKDYIICINGNYYYPMECDQAREIYTKLGNEAYALGYRREY